MRVCLVAPKTSNIINSYPPLGLGYLAAVLERDGHQVHILDLGLEPETSLQSDVQRILGLHPDLVGLTAMTSNYHHALAIAQALRATTSTPIVIGGPHATVFPIRVLQESPADYLVYGEGEETLSELVRALEAADLHPDADRLRAIQGLCFRQGKEVVQNPARPLIRDLDALPFPARHLFDLERYPLYAWDGQRMATILSSRGCPYHCSYCFKGIVGRIYRQRSVGNILAEIRQVMETYHLRHFYFIDDLFTINLRRLLEFTQQVLDEGLEIFWQCLARVDKVTPEILTQMRRAGCRQIHYGIESGNQRILDAIGKRITLEQVRQAVHWTREAGILSKGYFMLGLPGDTEETMEQTIQFASELELDEAMFSLTTPFPGTQLWDELCRKRPGIEFNADFSRAYYYNSYTEEIAPFLNVSEVSDARLARLAREAKARFWESKRKRRYINLLGRPLGTAAWYLTKAPALRKAGRWLLKAGLVPNQNKQQGSRV